MTAAPWTLMTLAPLSPTISDGVLAGLDVRVVTPDRDDPVAIRAALAEAEGLDAHARSALIRLKG